MTDDTRSRWQEWQLFRRDWSGRYSRTTNLFARRSLPLPSLSLTVGATYPSRVLVSVTGLTVGQTVTVTRTPAGSTTATTVRGADEVIATADALVIVDAEAPFGVLLTYTLTINGVATATATVTPTLAGGKVSLTDAISGAAVEVVILAWPNKRRERTASVFAVGGRNIVVSGQRGGFTGTIDLFTETDESKNNVLELLDSATSGILQIRQAGPYDGVDAYIAVLSDDEQRWSQDGSDERRIISLDVVEVGAWASSLAAAGFTLQDIADAYPNGTLSQIVIDYPGTLLDIALGDWSS